MGLGTHWIELRQEVSITSYGEIERWGVHWAPYWFRQLKQAVTAVPYYRVQRFDRSTST
uniref:Uncharacterized protein n=1 Tax=Anguilla anguilla TaxID=7936 RepID=A0A0E9XUG8_ANGAN